MKKTVKKIRAYLMTWSGTPFSFACLEETKKEHRHFYLPRNKRIRKWRPLNFIVSKGEGYTDYQNCDHGFQLFSKKFRELLDARKTTCDKYQWLNVTVSFKKEIREYYALHFYECDEILDIQHTLWDEDMSPQEAIVPAFRSEIVAKHSIFSHCDAIDTPYVTASLRRAILDAKLTGATFEETKVVQWE